MLQPLSTPFVLLSPDTICNSETISTKQERINDCSSQGLNAMLVKDRYSWLNYTLELEGNVQIMRNVHKLRLCGSTG